MTSFFTNLWYGKPSFWSRALLPFSFLYRLLSFLRRTYLKRFCQQTCPVPLIVIGNISVGGVGKTPLVIEIAQKMQEKGLRVGIVSRGYGAKITRFPYKIQRDDTASKVGDEPLLMAQKLKCPVVIAPDRNKAVDFLLTHYQCQIIISDDGLQHYRMGRAIEIAVIDGTRGVGNGRCLPAGPLREPVTRLAQVDFIVVNEGHWHNAYSMKLVPQAITNIATSQPVQPAFFVHPVIAIAGIGNPQRFYSTLSGLGIEFTPYSFPDHHEFKFNDLNYGRALVIMTEKDAIKCRSFNSPNHYFLPVKAVLDNNFWQALWSHQQLKGYC